MSNAMAVWLEFFCDGFLLRFVMHMHTLPPDLKGSQHVQFVSKGRTEGFNKKDIYRLHQRCHKIKGKRIYRYIWRTIAKEGAAEV